MILSSSEYHSQIKMDLHTFQSAIVFAVVVFKVSQVSGKECTNGFLDSLNVENNDPRRLVSLLGSTSTEQWIFPSLQFTCRGRLTKWTFRGMRGQATQCRINIATWRLDRRSFISTYRKLSTTEGNVAHITTDGPIITYELASPVRVKPGDIVGVEQTTYFCSLFETFDNILTLDISGTGSTSLSYRRSTTGSSFLVPTTGTINQWNNLVPLLQAVFETPEEPTIGNDVFTATNEVFATTTAAENNATTAMDRLTETTTVTVTVSSTLPTTTVGSPGLVITKQPGGRIPINIIHIVTAVGIGVAALLAIVVSCICVACITRRVQARSTKGRKCDTEQPQSISSNSNGTLLHDNTAYSESSTPWDITLYETMSTKESKKSDTEQRQSSSNSNGIVVQVNTAYKKSTNTEEITGYETTAEMTEQVMRLNLAYGSQSVSHDGRDSMNVGDYGRTTGTIAPENTEHPYDYII